VRRKYKCVFLDRGGVINKKAPEGDYIKNWSEFKFLPGVKEALKKLNKADFLVIIIANQRGITKGIMSEEDLKAIHIKIIEKLSKIGAKIDKIYYYPHDEKDNCECRKPKIGMLIEAEKDFNIEMSKSWLIGDSNSDIVAGQKAGCKIILINEKLYKNDILIDRGIKYNFKANNLKEAINKIIRS